MRIRAARVRAVGWVLCFAVCWGCAAKVQAPPEAPATVRRAEEAFRLRDYERAVELYRTYADLVRRDPYVPRVLYKAALAQYELGRYEDVLETLDELQSRYPDKRWVQVEALRGDAQRALGKPLAAIQAWDHAFSVARPADESKLRLRIATVAHSLSDEELSEATEFVASSQAKEILAAVGTQREHPEIPEPLPEFEAAVAAAPSGPESGSVSPSSSETALAGGESIPIPEGAAVERLPDERRIGVLVEGTSGDSDLATAVRLAAGAEHVVTRAVVDESGSVAAAFRALAGDPGVGAIIGASGGRAEELSRVARAHAVPFVDVDAGDTSGPYVVAAGPAPAQALGAVLDYAMGRARLRRIGIVYPDTLAGRQFLALAQPEVARRGGEIVGTDAYAPDARTVTAGLVRRWRDRGNLQAVLLSDTLVAAAAFARFLQQEMPDIPLLGVGDWEPLGAMVPEASGVVFASVFSPDREPHPFVEEFRAATGRWPSTREVCAYEAARWLGEVLGSVPPGVTRAELWSALQRTWTVDGPSGRVEIANARFVRHPVVVQFTRGELHEVAQPTATALALPR